MNVVIVTHFRDFPPVTDEMLAQWAAYPEPTEAEIMEVKRWLRLSCEELMALEATERGTPTVNERPLTDTYVFQRYAEAA
jgi:hypothetical protein